MREMSIKPHKVWSADRKIRKSLVAGSLLELKEKGIEKLNYSNSVDNVLAVLEEDGTEVDDEEYFTYLNANTTFMLLSEGQTWHAKGDPGIVDIDETDSPGDEGAVEICDVDGDGGPSGDFASRTTHRDITQLARSLHSNIANIVTFSNQELQLLAECNTDNISRLLSFTPQESRALQESCQRKLDERAEATDAICLLKLLRKSKDGEHKRPKGTTS